VQILLLSRLTAVALLAVYIGYLIFQLGTHKDMFAGEESEDTQQANMTLSASGLWLAGITVIVAFLSEYLTGSIEEVRRLAFV
jgi:Ca2+:H+ antiporter